MDVSYNENFKSLPQTHYLDFNYYFFSWSKKQLIFLFFF